MDLLRPALLLVLGGLLASGDLCLRRHTLAESPGEALLSDTDYGSECNISSPKSIQEVATTLYVTQTLNKLEFVPGVIIGLQVYDTCSEPLSVYKQALLSSVEADCSGHYDLGILAPERYVEELEPLRTLDVLPVASYKHADLSPVLVEVIVDFLAARFAAIDHLFASSRQVLGWFLDASQRAGLCVRENPVVNSTESIFVAFGSYADVSTWLEENGSEGVEQIWIVVPLDNSPVDDLLPQGAIVLQPERFPVNAKTPHSVHEASIARSPHLLGVGKAVVEVARVFQETRARSCPVGGGVCKVPRIELEERRPMSNAELYETLNLAFENHTIRYVVSQKVEDTLVLLRAYDIGTDGTVLNPETTRNPQLCLGDLSGECAECFNFLDREDYSSTPRVYTFKRETWVPIVLTVSICGTFVCAAFLAYVVRRFLVQVALDGHPAITVLVALTTATMLLTVVPFCLEDEAIGAGALNSRKILVTGLCFGLIFSLMLTRALFLACSARGVTPATEHINGYLEAAMFFFMFGVEIAIATVYHTVSTDDAAAVMRSSVYLALLSYDILLLMALFIVCCFITRVQRNYHEGLCFFLTATGMIACWTIWITCFCLVPEDRRDMIVSCGILITAYLIILGVLVPRTYLMSAYSIREKDVIARFEPADLGPDPRMNITARQALDSQGRRASAFSEYAAIGNVYSSGTPRRYPRAVSPVSPRASSPGYRNYGFRPEMRERGAAYVVPRLNVEELDVTPRRSVPQKSKAPRSCVPEARYALPRSLLRRNRSKVERPTTPEDDEVIEARHCPVAEVYVQDRLNPRPNGPDEAYPKRSSSPKLSPTHATIREEEEIYQSPRITRF